MKKFYISIFVNFALVLLVAFILFFPHKTKDSQFSRVEKIPGDTVIITKTIDQPFPYLHYIDTGSVKYIDTGSTHFIFQKLDSAQLSQIAIKYFTRNIYLDTLKNDSSAFIAILDTVWMNQLQKRSLLFQNRRITSINYFSVSKHKTAVYVGASVGGNLKGFDFGPAVMLNFKNKYSFGYQFQVLEKKHFFSIFFGLN